ncbi:RNA pyrophosphohydrolase [Helicobacter cetorum]|uniref:RNA pyrophosphohydrolase n=1 Tax=Helicobacter cetorum (strain ATCC BAA-540 / CCUG 52418 / MIT 99-5656) TaxID=1163745 RepID=I0EUB1_HELCM|nr:RNA pyrophosphohydrolase [Helicobacter cetorum]AFI06530.1 RNA pyrophosphohydrolase [Helicobacter cetorum MIT 99-5656]
MLHNKRYRPNVAAIIVSPSYPNTCEVFIAERVDIEGAWQFPQGGIDEGETPLEALYRELKEEIGTDKIEVLAQYPRWIAYDFPNNMEHKFYSFDGQKQRYFLVRLKHLESIDLNTHAPEFRAYQFIPLKDLLKKVAPFKRQVYRQVISHFKKEGYLGC